MSSSKNDDVKSRTATQKSQSSVENFASARAGDIEAKMQLLFDRAEIADVVRRYAQGIDTRDFDLLRTCYTDEIEMDFRPTVPDLDRTHFTVDEWVEMVSKFHSQFDGTEHILIPEGIDVNGDSASCYAVMHASHFKKDSHGAPHHLISGSYSMEFTRTTNGWKMCKASQVVRWVEGNWYNHIEASKNVMAQSEN